MVSGLGVLLVSLLLVSLLLVSLLIVGIQQNNMVLGLIGMGVIVIGVMISLRRAYARKQIEKLIALAVENEERRNES